MASAARTKRTNGVAARRPKRRRDARNRVVLPIVVLLISFSTFDAVGAQAATTAAATTTTTTSNGSRKDQRDDSSSSSSSSPLTSSSSSRRRQRTKEGNEGAGGLVPSVGGGGGGGRGGAMASPWSLSQRLRAILAVRNGAGSATTKISSVAEKSDFLDRLILEEQREEEEEQGRLVENTTGRASTGGKQKTRNRLSLPHCHDSMLVVAAALGGSVFLLLVSTLVKGDPFFRPAGHVAATTTTAWSDLVSDVAKTLESAVGVLFLLPLIGVHAPGIGGGATAVFAAPPPIPSSSVWVDALMILAVVGRPRVWRYLREHTVPLLKKMIVQEFWSVFWKQTTKAVANMFAGMRGGYGTAPATAGGAGTDAASEARNENGGGSEMFASSGRRIRALARACNRFVVDAIHKGTAKLFYKTIQKHLQGSAGTVWNYVTTAIQEQAFAWIVPDAILLMSP